MRIISNFKDYYDSVQAFGHDTNVTYVRKTESFNFDNSKFEDIVGSYNTACGMDSHIYQNIRFVLGFCGKMYNGFRIASGDFNRTFWSVKDVEKYLNRILDKHLRQREQHSFYGKGRWRKPTSRKFDKFFDTRIPDTDELFFEYGVPTFIVQMEVGSRNKLEIVVNPKLDDYEFFKIHDPYQAYQNIDMYLSGVIGNSPPDMIEISDEMMRDKKGFNEWSFKTRPAKTQ